MMRRTSIAVSVVAVLSMAIFAVSALGKEKAPVKKDSAEECDSPTCPMPKPAKAAEEESKRGTEAKMAKMGMSKGMMTRCRMLMRTRIETNDPAGLLAIKDELKLTKEQVGKLQTIADKARKEAKALLSDEQKKKLEAVPETPGNMMEMYGKMKPMIQKSMGGHNKGKASPMVCPMNRPQGGKSTSKTPATEATEQ
ncbi:MAG: hypothetical protein GWP14_11115 [Actinobacteria bacterium]|nr:hypothetical protein [Actinomycetota bacterium]